METMVTIKAEPRNTTGKKVRSLRKEGWTPGIVYGLGESFPVQLAHKELVEAYREVGTSALIGLFLEHQKKARPAIIREIQRHPISLEILHVDFELVDLKRPLTTHVPIVFAGHSPIVEQGLAVLTHGLNEIELRCLPSDVPAHLEVNLALLTEADASIHVRDLVVPPEVQILTEPDTVVVYTTSLRRLEEAEARAEAEVAAEGEVGVVEEEAAEEAEE
jgi:large subunit ribosomal protein L25